MFVKHGHTRNGRPSPTWHSWASMRQRCSYPKARCYEDYGGRGIKVCARWEDSFENFLSDMGEKPRGYVLDRIDNDGNYKPSNCKWSSTRESSRNKRSAVRIEYKGETKCLKDWCSSLNLDYQAVYKRLNNYCWPVDEAFETKVSRGNPKIFGRK